MRDLRDAVAGGQLGNLGDDIRRVWYHPRGARATAWDVSHPNHDSIAAAEAASVAGIYPLGDVDSLEFSPALAGRALADDDLLTRRKTEYFLKYSWGVFLALYHPS